ncbi:MAG: porin family protein [Chitinophagales bacterium]
MKRITISVLVILMSFTFFKSNAQVPGKFYLGARFMPTISDFKVSQSNGDLYKTQAVIGYGFGGLLGVNLTDHVGLQGELLYSPLAQDYVDNMNVNRRITLNYVNIPLLLVLNTNSSSPVNLNFAVGPQFGILAGSSFDATGSAEGDTITAVFAAKPADIGIAYGAGLDFSIVPNFSIDIGYRGVIGLVDVSDQSKSITTDQYYLLDRSHLMTYAVYAGVKFKF